jgi:AraC-like DNA-binding protein
LKKYALFGLKYNTTMKSKVIYTLEVSHLNLADDNLKNDFAISDTSEDIIGITIEHPVKINSLLVGICTKGKGNITVNLKSMPLSERDVIALSPGTIIQYEPDEISSDFFMRYMLISLEFVSAFDASYLYPDARQTSYFKADIEEYKIVMKLYDNLLEKYNHKDGLFRRQIIQHTLLSGMYEFALIEKNHTSLNAENLTKIERLVWEFYQLLFKYYRNEQDTSFYAERLLLSTKYLSTIIKKQTGKTVNEWIFEYIIAEAKALIKSSKITIKELAEYFNYADATSFGKFFKKRVGMTPNEYRHF